MAVSHIRFRRSIRLSKFAHKSHNHWWKLSHRAHVTRTAWKWYRAGGHCLLGTKGDSCHRSHPPKFRWTWCALGVHKSQGFRPWTENEWLEIRKVLEKWNPGLGKPGGNTTRAVGTIFYASHHLFFVGHVSDACVCNNIRVGRTADMAHTGRKGPTPYPCVYRWACST